MLLYDEASQDNITIDYDQRPCPYHTKIAELVCRHASERQHTVLDVGCGPGNTLAEIERLRPGFDFTIADIDPHCLRLAQEKIPVSASYRVGSCRDLRQIDERFDVILLSHVLQYDNDPVSTMQRLLGMLRPGGFVVAATPNPAALPILMNNLLRRDYCKGNAFIWDRSVFKNFLINIVGAEVHAMSEDYVPLPLLTRYRAFRPLETGLARLLPWFAFSVIAVLGAPAAPQQRGAA